MNPPDETLDKLLAGLRDAQPSVGLERRILAGVQQRAAQRAARSLHPAWFGAGAVALALLLAIGLTLSRHRVAGLPSRLSSPMANRSVPGAPTAPSTVSAVRPRSRRPKHREQRQASAAVSFPAPPLPLTEQEKLLLAVARRGYPATLPMLDPDVLAQRESEAEAKLEAALAYPGVPKFEPLAAEWNRKGDLR